MKRWELERIARALRPGIQGGVLHFRGAAGMVSAIVGREGGELGGGSIARFVGIECRGIPDFPVLTLYDTTLQDSGNLYTRDDL